MWVLVGLFVFAVRLLCLVEFGGFFEGLDYLVCVFLQK